MVTVTINRNGNTKTHTYKHISKWIFNRVVQTINAEVTVTFSGHTDGIKWTETQTKREFIDNWIGQLKEMEGR